MDRREPGAVRIESGRYGRTLLVSFAAVIAAFSVASAYSQYRASRIDEPALAIASNAAPSIRELAGARAELRHMQALLNVQLRAAQARSPDLEELRAARRRFEGFVRAYLLLPYFPGELELWRGVEDSVDQLDQAMDRATDALSARRPAEAERIAADEVDPAAQRTADALVRSIDFNADQAAALARYIERTRKRSFAIAVALDLAAAAAAVFLALVLVRVSRAHDRVMAERNQLLAQQAEELEAFAGRVAHDILNPLGAVTMALERAAAQATDERVARSVGRARGAAERARRLVDDLLAFARTGGAPDEAAEADLAEVVRDVVRDIEDDAAAANAIIEVNVPDALHVACAAGALGSIVGNLVRNALKFGTQRPGNAIAVAARPRHGAVHVEVADHGPGIPDELLPRIFLPHVRGRGSGVPGLGLGLATVKRLVEAHGGAIGVRSTPGEGSVFWFELPLV